MRNNLIIQLYCAECGKVVNMDYDTENDLPPQKADSLSENPKSPTGAACLHMPGIYVHPCKHCIQKYTGPAKQLAESLRSLTQGDKEQ
jgi:hypothetical protein